MACCSGNDSESDAAAINTAHESTAEQGTSCCSPKRRFDYLLWGGSGHSQRVLYCSLTAST